LSRRRFLATLGAVITVRHVERLLAAQDLALPPGRLARTMALGRFDGRPPNPLGTLLGDGLDARLFTDLSALTPASLVTPTDRFFIRTAASTLHKTRERRDIAIGGVVRNPTTIPIADLTALSRPLGTHLMECSGNTDPADFGLISSASWDGVPISALLDRIQLPANASSILVTGLDDDSRTWRTSAAGASWIFSRRDLERSGAFLATAMNGAPLTPDHGFPARLVVPNWYGCVCIKWVTRIDVVGDDEPPTLQMREFAVRTHQRGMPSLAREFQPARIDLAATPVRVEQWVAGDEVRYRVIGIAWGGDRTVRPLTIRFRHDQPFVPVDDCPPASSSTTWNLWSHVWRPTAPGRYQIVLGTADPALPAKRLSMYHYTREVDIDRV
jgi:DMSO/TMAO reductase YedYZ molybdopterin-dependent catalytic subunit